MSDVPEVESAEQALRRMRDHLTRRGFTVTVAPGSDIAGLLDAADDGSPVSDEDTLAGGDDGADEGTAARGGETAGDDAGRVGRRIELAFDRQAWADLLDAVARDAHLLGGSGGYLHRGYQLVLVHLDELLLTRVKNAPAARVTIDRRRVHVTPA